MSNEDLHLAILGKSRSSFKKHSEDINDLNFSRLGSYFLVGLSVSGLSTLALFAAGEMMDGNLLMLVFIFFVLMFIMYRNAPQLFKKNSTGKFYAFLLPVFIVLAIINSAGSPEEEACLFLVVMVAVPSFILDKPLRLIFYTIALTVMFDVMVLCFKPEPARSSDLVNSLIALCLSVGVSLYMLDVRISNVEIEDQLKRQSTHDRLTGILNRRGGEDMIHRYIENNVSGTFFIIDVDDFKHFNDNYGHGVGDEVLVRTAQSLLDSFRSSDIVMRLGGDEFAVFAPCLLSEEMVRTRASLLRENTSRIVVDRSTGDHCTLSIGALIADKPSDYDELYKKADELLYESKGAGKDTCTIGRL